MSPTQCHAKQHDNHQKPLNINIDTNFSHRLMPPAATGPSTTYDGITNKTHQQQPPPPVIIYTHSPKVIHTRPCDFMALVQKLTGYTPQPTQDQRQNQDLENVEDSESSSVVTEEHGSPLGDSCVVDGGVVVPPPPYNVARFDPYFSPTPHRFTLYTPDSLLLNRNLLYSDI
ncbi:uncharacterized protein LOC143622561 [Bidens hawaiensis]|uniref:uncharacterized protein LOC143622561 n=1 Tax=Bidens hawaiensis TaxID=980011 RepID=UPI00404AED86